MLLSEHRYYQFVREERLFCATLAHLLMQKGANLHAFMELVNTQLHPQDLPLSNVNLDRAEVYLEFAFLRDYWYSLGSDNVKKRNFIFERLARADSLAGFKSNDFPPDISEFNEFFMGPRGKRIKEDIVYPGQWSVANLDRKFSQNEQFRNFCKFKWAFNIKPDLVILTPNTRPFCIEAKLESREGWYPGSDTEAQIFDRRFGPDQGRVRQLEEQSFMFDRILGSPCHLVMIGREGADHSDTPFLIWMDVFKRLDTNDSIAFVRKLIGENVHLETPAVRST